MDGTAMTFKQPENLLKHAATIAGWTILVGSTVTTAREFQGSDDTDHLHTLPAGRTATVESIDWHGPQSGVAVTLAIAVDPADAEDASDTARFIIQTIDEADKPWLRHFVEPNRSYSPGRGHGLLSGSLDGGRVRVRSARNAVGRLFDGGSALEKRGLA